MDFCEACISRQTSQEDAFQKLEEMSNRQVDVLRKLTKKVQDARHTQDEEVVKGYIEEYDECIEK